MSRARRLPSRIRGAFARRGVLAALLAGPAGASEVWEDGPLIGARYAEPTGRYAHGVLGDAIEYGALELTYLPQRLTYTIRLPQERVFEDVAPRMIDVDGDGRREAVVVESHHDQGARLAVYNGGGLVAATPYIGTRFRWLAPIGAADLDGDGFIEIAYIDRPHLAKTLRVWRFQDANLEPVASLSGLTNHRIGESDIGGGIRDCGQGPEMITASANWRRIMATTLTDGQLQSRDIGTHTGRASLNAALACQ